MHQESEGTRYRWSHLNRLQLGRYAEYLVKMELTLAGLEVFTSEVDDRGIDFVIRKHLEQYWDIQVKSARKFNYIFFHKDKFELRKNLIAAVVLFTEGESPNIYLIPSLEWRRPDSVLVDRDYNGKRSKPEFGLNLSRKCLPLLEKYRLEDMLSSMLMRNEGNETRQAGERRTIDGSPRRQRQLREVKEIVRDISAYKDGTERLEIGFSKADEDILPYEHYGRMVLELPVGIYTATIGLKSPNLPYLHGPLRYGDEGETTCTRVLREMQCEHGDAILFAVEEPRRRLRFLKRLPGKGLPPRPGPRRK